MKSFKELISDFKKVYIQTHNNPDADAISSAYGMKELVESFAKESEIIYYGGEINKPNLSNMIKEYRIKMSIIGEGFRIKDDDLLIVVDGQYGGGNVVKVEAKNIIVIDHHLEESDFQSLYSDIQPRIGACATMIFDYIEEYKVDISEELATILYFGIYMDTDSFTGKMTILDEDTKKKLEKIYDKNVFDYLRLSTLTFEDIKVCAQGMLNTQRYDNILFSKIGDSSDNLLGHISDLLSEIDGIDIVLIYSTRKNGFKLSIRSYHDYITAQEIALELVRGIGFGGGHPAKAGGFILKDKFKGVYPNISFDILIRTKLIDYCRNLRFFQISKDDPFKIYGEKSFFKAKKRINYFRYINLGDYFDDTITVKTLEGVEEATPEDKLIIGLKNEVWPIDKLTFNKRYEIIDDNSVEPISDKFIDGYGIRLQSLSKTYKINNENISECHICKSLDRLVVNAVQIKENLRVRTSWGDLSGREGDYLLVWDIDDYYIVAEEVFNASYDSLD